MPAPPTKVSLPPNPIRMSLPSPPFSVLAAALPQIWLASSLPVRLIEVSARGRARGHQLDLGARVQGIARQRNRACRCPRQPLRPPHRRHCRRHRSRCRAARHRVGAAAARDHVIARARGDRVGKVRAEHRDPLAGRRREAAVDLRIGLSDHGEARVRIIPRARPDPGASRTIAVPGRIQRRLQPAKARRADQQVALPRALDRDLHVLQNVIAVGRGRQSSRPTVSAKVRTRRRTLAVSTPAPPSMQVVAGPADQAVVAAEAIELVGAGIAGQDIDSVIALDPVGQLVAGEIDRAGARLVGGGQSLDARPRRPARS